MTVTSPRRWGTARPTGGLAAPAGPSEAVRGSVSVRAGPPRPAAEPRYRRWTDPLVDTAAAFILAVLAVIGLHHVFVDRSYLLIGAAGAGLGTLVALAGHVPRARDPLNVTLALIAAFVLGGAPAVPDRAGLGVVPTPGTAVALVEGLVHAWKAIVTTAVPVTVDAGLGVIPYTLGFVAAAAGLVVARRTRSPLAPAVPALAALIAGFLLGTDAPVSVGAQGAGVPAAALAWGAVRANRARRAEGPAHWPRLASGTAMLAIVAVLGVVIGPRLPIVGGPTAPDPASDRLHLRRWYEPPFDPHDEPSPLAAFHSYVAEGARDEIRFSVTGLPPDARLRLAAMDAYDGSTWTLGGAGAPASGVFERPGATIPAPAGRPATVTVHVSQQRPDVWVPIAGAIESVRFDGDRARELAESFRYNRTLRAAAVPVRLRPGDTVTMQAQLPLPLGPEGEELARRRAPVGLDLLPPLPPLPAAITQRATALTLDAPTDYDKARVLAAALRDGTPGMATYYSDGGAGTEHTAARSASGHNLARLVKFVESPQGLVGNAEQYAAAMALMARYLGLPARVVMGFRAAPRPGCDAGSAGATGEAPAEAQPIRGRDVDAWVEIAFDGVGPVVFDPTPPCDRRPDETPRVTDREVDLSQQEPPPPTHLQLPDTLPDVLARPPEPPHPAPSPLDLAAGLLRIALLVLSPLWLAAAAAGLIAALKAGRARRRRLRGPPAERLAGAWWELCDRARDLGAVIPLRATRREVARAVAPVLPGAPPLAARIDEAMFAAPAPGEGEVAAIWERLDAEHDQILARLGPGPRLRAALNLASLRPRRWQRP